MNTVIVKCDFCGKKVEKKTKNIQRYKTHFCDKKCQLKFISASSTATEEECHNCGKKITRTNNQKRSSKTGLYFCGNLCKNRYVARNLRWGDNPDDHRGRRERILSAAKCKCQKCNYSEDARMLEIHHNDQNHHNNRWDNLRCLCSWCHTKHHREVEIIDNLPALTITA